MSRQFDQCMDGKFELNGEQYEIIAPTSITELPEAFSVRDALQNALNAKMHDEDTSVLESLLQQQEDEIKAFGESIKPFDNNILISNIKYFARQYRLQLGDIERLMGISPGYISRTFGATPKKRMSIDSVWKLSMFFNININDFVRHDYSSLGQDRSIIDQFINTLQHDTQYGEHNWTFCWSDTDDENEKFYQTGLIKKMKDGIIHYLPMEDEENGIYWEAGHAAILKNFDNGKDLVIFPYKRNDEKYTEYDYLLIWRENRTWKWEKMFSTWFSDLSDLTDATDTLYEDIRSSVSEIRIKPSIREMMIKYNGNG